MNKWVTELKSNEKWGNYSSFKGKKKNEFKESKLCWIKVDYRIKNDVVKFGKEINQITFKCNILCDLKKMNFIKFNFLFKFSLSENMISLSVKI